MAEQVNVYRSAEYEDFIQKLAGSKIVGKPITIFPTIRELLCFAALLGYSEGNKKPFRKNKTGVQDQDISWSQFEATGSKSAEELIHLIAVADTKDPEILKEGRQNDCVRIFEEYANGGLELMQDAQIQFDPTFEDPEKAIIKLMAQKKYFGEFEQQFDAAQIDFS